MAKGSAPQAPQFIQPPPPQITQAPPPNVQQNAADLARSQLEFNPQLAQQATDIQRQQAPQLAKSEYDIQAQYGPMYRALYEKLFPTQVQGQETLATQALQRLQSPQGLTPEQQSAQDFTRNYEQDRLLRGIRTQANLGGNLYSGNRELQEQQGLAELARGYAQQDIGLQDQRRAQALQELIASSQVVFPQVQQPGVQQFGQGVTPSADALLQAIMQGQIIQQPVYQPGNPGHPGFFQSQVRGLGGQPGGFY